jgi:hypothetical protein
MKRSTPTTQQAKALGCARGCNDLAERRPPARPWKARDRSPCTARLTRRPDAISTPESFRSALALSNNFRLNLDIGHFTAANYEAVAFIQENHAIISHCQIKDRTRNGGMNERFGEGDTPIKEVLALIKEKHWAIPTFVEYEYIGLGTPQEEVRKCLAYTNTALA